MYHNYRNKKEKKLTSLIKRESTTAVTDGEGEPTKKTEVLFHLESKRFSEMDGTLHPSPEREEIDLEALEREKGLLQGFIEDIDELLADVEALKEE